VKSLARVASILSVMIVAFVAIALIGVNLYVQSQGTQARIQQELSQRLGTPLHIRSASVTPWGGLTLTGITIPQTSPATSSDFLDAKSFHLHVRLLSLFSRQLVIKKVSLLSPLVVWPQNSDGKWRLPGGRREGRHAGRPDELAAAPAKTDESGASSPPDSGTLTAPAGPPPETAVTLSQPKTDTTNNAFVPEVRRVNLTSGNFRFLDRSGNLVATFEGVDFHSTMRSVLSLRGTAKIAKVSLRDRFFLEQLQSPLHYEPNQLDLSNISAHVGGGEMSGQFSVQPQAKDSPFSASVKFRNAEADRLIAEAGGPKGVVQGKLEGNFQASGKTADRVALDGGGEIFLRNGQVQQYSLLVALGQILQIEELTQLHLEQAEARYHINSGLITIDELILRSPNIRLSATGTVNLNGKLRLDSQLAINEKVRGQLFKPIRENFRPIAEAGYSAVDFQVSGTVDRPKSNLMEKVVGRDLKDFVSGFFGGVGKPDRAKKKKSADAATNPAGATSPAPTGTPGAVVPAPSPTPPAP
jgi:type II secretion system protein N